MEPAILFVLVLLLLFLGVPVAVALGLSSLIIIAFFSSDSISSVALQLFTASQNYTLLAIPFFILASASCRRAAWRGASSGSPSLPSAIFAAVWQWRLCWPA